MPAISATCRPWAATCFPQLRYLPSIALWRNQPRAQVAFGFGPHCTRIHGVAARACSGGVVILPSRTVLTQRLVARVTADAAVVPLAVLNHVHPTSPTVLVPSALSSPGNVAYAIAATEDGSALRLHRFPLPSNDTAGSNASAVVDGDVDANTTRNNASTSSTGETCTITVPITPTASDTTGRSGDNGVSTGLDSEDPPPATVIGVDCPIGTHRTPHDMLLSPCNTALYLAARRPLDPAEVPEAEAGEFDSAPPHFSALETLDVSGLRALIQCGTHDLLSEQSMAGRTASETVTHGGSDGAAAYDNGESASDGLVWCQPVHNADARFPLWSRSQRVQVPGYFRDRRKEFDALLQLPAFDFGQSLVSASENSHTGNRPRVPRARDIRPALCGVDNIVLPKWNLVFDTTEPLGPVLDRAVDIPSHGTYEQIHSAAVGDEWVALLSRSFNHGTSYVHVALHCAGSLAQKHALGMHTVPPWTTSCTVPAWQHLAFVPGTDRLVIAAGVFGVATLDVAAAAAEAGPETAGWPEDILSRGKEGDDEEVAWQPCVRGGDGGCAAVQQRLVYTPVISPRLAAATPPPEGCGQMAERVEQNGGETTVDVAQQEGIRGEGVVVKVIPVPGVPDLVVAVVTATADHASQYDDDTPDPEYDYVVVRLPR